MLNRKGFTILEYSISIHAPQVQAPITPVIDEQKRFLSLSSRRLQPLAQDFLRLCQLAYCGVDGLRDVRKVEIFRQNVAQLTNPD